MRQKMYWRSFVRGASLKRRVRPARRQSNRWRDKRHHGFTLLEVLVAIFVLAVGILALDAMHLSSVRGNALAGRMTEAMIVGRRHLETLSRLPYDHPSLEDRAAGNDLKFPDPQAQLPEHQVREDRYILSWNVGDDVFAPGTKSILLTVTWAEGGVRRCVSLNCLIAPNG